MTSEINNRVTLLVDVQNIYYTTRQIHKCNFDFNVFWARATEGRTVVKAIAYAIDRGDEKQRQFQNILRAIGFEVKLKTFIQRADGTAKGDWDVGITLDAVEYAKESDVVVLASGDGDFGMLVDKLRGTYNVDVDVYGVRELTSTILSGAASRFIPVEGDLLLQRR